MYPLLSLRSLPTLSSHSIPHSHFIRIVFNTAMIFPRRAYVSVEHFPLAKRFSGYLIIHCIRVIDFLAMFLPSSDEWSIMLHWRNRAIVCCVYCVLTVWGTAVWKSKALTLSRCHISICGYARTQILYNPTSYLRQSHMDLMNYFWLQHFGCVARWLPPSLCHANLI